MLGTLDRVFARMLGQAQQQVMEAFAHPGNGPLPPVVYSINAVGPFWWTKYSGSMANPTTNGILFILNTPQSARMLETIRADLEAAYNNFASYCL
jgi:hypothetical protein